MRFTGLAAAASILLSAAVGPSSAAAEDARDFVFTDDEGHLVLRFAGAGPGGLDASQIEEVVNVQLSTMVHDRLRADTLFEAEPVDAPWAEAMERRIETHVREARAGLSPIAVECRSASCRLLLQHAAGRSVSEHQALMGAVQRIVRDFVEAGPGSFEHVFLIAGHFQEPGTPSIKVFLRSSEGRNVGG